MNVGSWIGSLLQKSIEADTKAKEASQLMEEEKDTSSFLSNGHSKKLRDDNPFCLIPCKSIKFGSYSTQVKNKVIFNQINLEIYLEKEPNPVHLIISKDEILKVLAHFDSDTPLIFVYVSLRSCIKIRELLELNNPQSGLWFDVSGSDEAYKKIILHPEKRTLEASQLLLSILGSDLYKEVSLKTAQSIFTKSQVKNDSTVVSGSKGVGSGIQNKILAPSMKYCTFPLTGSNSVSVTTEDYCVLEDECFLNDVIIDFYMRYLLYKIIEETDRDRTHIYSTYFYNRLTSRPNIPKNKPHPVEDDPNLTKAEKRYERVKRWTKKVNVFEKDFVIVPINENSHWFVAVICFPGLIGAKRIDNDEPAEAQSIKLSSQADPASAADSNDHLPPLKGKQKLSLSDNPPERDEAEATTDDLMDEDTLLHYLEMEEFEENPEKGSEDPVEQFNESIESSTTEDNTNTPNSSKINEKISVQKKCQETFPIKQPCILVFDSLPTSSRAKVVATLRDYLTCEYKAKMGEFRNFTKENMIGHCPKVLQQPNFTDCGIFVLEYIETFFKSPIKDYRLPLLNLRKWVEPQLVRQKRSNIAKIIRNLAKEQNPEKEIEFPNIYFTPDSGSGYTDNEPSDCEPDSKSQLKNDDNCAHKSEEKQTENISKNNANEIPDNNIVDYPNSGSEDSAKRKSDVSLAEQLILASKRPAPTESEEDSDHKKAKIES